MESAEPNSDGKFLIHFVNGTSVELSDAEWQAFKRFVDENGDKLELDDAASNAQPPPPTQSGNRFADLTEPG